MQQLVTNAIVLSRINYGEADRIVTALTPHYGKVRLIAKGVRRVKSRLAGGIELFSVSQITFIRGRSEIGTLVSARLAKHYGAIVSDIVRVQLGYEIIKLMNKTIEDEVEPVYFGLLEQAFGALSDHANSEALIYAWFAAHLLRHGGHMPNLQTDEQQRPLQAGQLYDFDFSAIAFTASDHGRFTTDHIKLMRLLFSGTQPSILRQISGSQQLLPDCAVVIQAMLNTYIKI